MTQKRKSVVRPAEPSVLVEGQPAAIVGRSTDSVLTPISGEPTVLIAGQPAASLDAVTLDRHGSPTVLIAGHPAKTNATRY